MEREGQGVVVEDQHFTPFLPLQTSNVPVGGERRWLAAPQCIVPAVGQWLAPPLHAIPPPPPPEEGRRTGSVSLDLNRKLKKKKKAEEQDKRRQDIRFRNNE